MLNRVKDRLKNINRYHIALLIIMLFSAMTLLYLTMVKAGMHVDEFLTYGLANHEEDGNNKISLEYGVRMDATDVFDEFFYADGFSLRNVWMNQSYDVHPPLYYLCFHIFTLLTHHFLALKTGILLNIIFHLINIGLVWLVLKELLGDNMEALFGAALYAFLPIELGNVLFIRMYVLLSTFVLALTLNFVRELNHSDKKAFYIKLGLITVAGTLTHYYFLVYLFFCCMVWGIYILIKRRWRELAVFLITMLASAAVSIGVFPYMLDHIFSGYRGEESFDNFLSTDTFVKNITAYKDVIDKVYGGFLLAVIIVAVLTFAYMHFLQDKEERLKRQKGNTLGWIIVFVPCLMYLLMISKIAVISTSRYISPVYAVCIILLLGLFDKICSLLSDKKLVYIAGILMVAILLNNSYKTYTWSPLYLEAGDCIDEARKYGINNECIYVLGISWHSFTAYQEFIQYENITFIRNNNLGLLYDGDYKDYDHVVMYFDNSVGEDFIEEVLTKMIEINPGLDSYEKLHEFAYNSAYYLD